MALGASFEYVAEAGFKVRGVVRDLKTGLPVSGVQMRPGAGGLATVTDAQGCYEIMGFRKSCPYRQAVEASSQAGRPYFSTSKHIPANIIADTVTVDFDLVSGVELSGKITNRATGKAPRSAVVKYFSLPSNPRRGASSALINSDGSYALAVVPGPGIVSVAASPCDAYASAEVDRAALGDVLREDIIMVSAVESIAIDAHHAILAINPDEKAQALTLDIKLQPAATVEGTAVGPRGERLCDVECYGQSSLSGTESLEDGAFTITGLKTQGQREVIFRQQQKGLCKICTVSASDKGPLVVKLEPCGFVIGRLVDHTGKPVANAFVMFRCDKPNADVSSVWKYTDSDGRFR